MAARGVVMPHNGEPVCVRIGGCWALASWAVLLEPWDVNVLPWQLRYTVCHTELHAAMDPHLNQAVT